MAFTAVATYAGCGAGCGGPRLGSIGAVLRHDSHEGTLLVEDAPVGLSGESAGLLEGDQVKMIDGVLVDDLDGRRIRALLRGAVGSKVTLTVVRGDEVMHLEIERGEIGQKSPLAERFEKIE